MRGCAAQRWCVLGLFNSFCQLGLDASAKADVPELAEEEEEEKKEEEKSSDDSESSEEKKDEL